MIVWKDAPSFKRGPHIHLDPLWTRTNKSRALTYAHVSAYDLTYLAAIRCTVATRTCITKCSANRWRSPSMEDTKGANIPLLCSTAFFFPDYKAGALEKLLVNLKYWSSVVNAAGFNDIKCLVPLLLLSLYYRFQNIIIVSIDFKVACMFTINNNNFYYKPYMYCKFYPG